MKQNIIATFLLFASIAIAFLLQALFTATNTSSSAPDQSPYPPPKATSDLSPTPGDFIDSTSYPAPPENTPLPPFPVNYHFYLPLVKTPYNRAKAVWYADQWAHGRNGNYPNYGSGCGCNDCTNYVSQAIHDNGNLTLKTGDWDPNDFSEWWYKKVLWRYENSNTWSATDWFTIFTTEYPSEFEFRSSPPELEWGDFFPMDLRGANPSDPPDGIPDHIRFVVGYGYTSTNQIDYTDGCGVNNTIPTRAYMLLINQHCVDRQHVAWDYNLPGSIGLWSIHVK